MDQYKDFAKVLESFFMGYLVQEKGCSTHTIRAYRDAFTLFLSYLEDEHHIKPDRISLAHVNKVNVLNYLDWLETNKSATVRTRNHRCVVMKSFCKYLMYVDPLHMAQWKQVCSIQGKKGPKGSIHYLTIDGIKSVLETIDVSSVKGRRDLTMLSLLYNTGARVQELIDLTPSSLRLSKPSVVMIHGKGNKTRIVPLDDNIVRLLETYLDEQHLNLLGRESHPLFYNTWGEKLTTPGVSYVLNKYYHQAQLLHSELFPSKISPHVLRHSRAMHLLQAGVNLIYIRDILGHVSIQTTEIYARADSDQKRKALENAYAEVGLTEPKVKSWEKNSKLKEYLKSLA
ncbi:MAG: tyrosine-type recombinase/integrase [Bacteroidales bacterium]|nr:tyrosine-type recombinase/integrase [Bacteroidales bacterium]MBR5174740.1 tyrosine-type recombinase/integrase [Bacteroidales bacterium]